MKPSKTTKNTKKELIKQNTATKIQTYFKTAPKQFVVEKKAHINDESANIKEFYVQALKEKLKSFAVEGNDAEVLNEERQYDDGACGIQLDDKTHIEEHDDIASKILECAGCIEKTAESKEWEEKYKTLKKVYIQLTIQYSEQSIKFEHLLKAKGHIGHTTHDNTGQTIEHNTGHTPSLVVDVQGQSKDDIFTPHETKYLQGMSLERSKDSTFIMKCLQFAYKNNLSILRLKTLKGKHETVLFDEVGETENIAGKDPLTPLKVDRIKDLFLERLSKCQIDSVTYKERIQDSNINKLFASGIKNISKKQKD